MAEYGFRSQFLPSAPSGSNENFSCPAPQPTYPRGRPCSLSCCNPTNNTDFKPPFYHVVPPGCSPQVQYSAFRPIHPVDENNVTAYYWVDTHAWGGVPSTALHGGVDVDGEQIYVGRAYHNGDWLPAKVIPGRNIAYVCYGGEEHHKDSFQVLCEQRFDWIPNHGGYIPPGAIEGGRTSDGEILYIGRVEHEGTQTVGKNQGYICLRASLNTRSEWLRLFSLTKAIRKLNEQFTTCEDVAVKYLSEVHSSGPEVTDSLLEKAESAVFWHQVHPSHGVCYIPFDGQELSFEDYEILVLRR